MYSLLKDEDDDYYIPLKIEQDKRPQKIEDCLPENPNFHRIHESELSGLIGQMITPELKIVRIWYDEFDYIHNMNDWCRLCYYPENMNLYPNFWDE